MAANYRLEPGALAEYEEAARYYLNETEPPETAVRFIAAVESALATICAAPEVWRVVEPPGVRRYVLQRFPYVLYYRYRSAENLVVIFAVMHTSRQPGYWRGRLPTAG